MSQSFPEPPTTESPTTQPPTTEPPTAEQPNADARAPSEQRTPTLLEKMGGVGGLVSSALPAVAFCA